MSTAAVRPMSLEAFLEWERARDTRYEFDGVGPVAMTGGTIHHRRVADDLAGALTDRLTGRGCEVLAGDVKILVAGRVRYPDVVVACAPQDGAGDIVVDPVMVVEILSPGTARTDRVLKLEEYRLTPSIQHYLLLDQDAPTGTLYTRDGDAWLAAAVAAPGDIVLPALDISIPLAEAYRRVLPPA